MSKYNFRNQTRTKYTELLSDSEQREEDEEDYDSFDNFKFKKHLNTNG